MPTISEAWAAVVVQEARPLCGGGGGRGAARGAWVVAMGAGMPAVDEAGGALELWSLDGETCWRREESGC